MAFAIVAIIALPQLIAWATTPVKNQPAVKPIVVPQTIKPSIPNANRQQSNRVFLDHADVLHKNTTDSFMIVTGNVRFSKNGMLMFCDSAHYYPVSQSFNAFGNVRMEQGDTLFIYADELNYDGRVERAYLYGDYQPVRMINRDVKLTTYTFTYDMVYELGYYEENGKLTDPKNQLTSIRGEYSPKTKEAHFMDDVVLYSNNKKDTINTEVLVYNTATKVADVYDRTVIRNPNGRIYTSLGIYNTNTGQAELLSRSSVVASSGVTLEGDTLYYDRNVGYGVGFGRVEIVNPKRKSSLLGDYGYYNEKTDSAFVTGRALAKEYSHGDTLYMHGRYITATLAFDTIKTPIVDSIAAPAADQLDNTTSMSLPQDSVAVIDEVADVVVEPDSIVSEDVVVAEVEDIPAQPTPDTPVLEPSVPTEPMAVSAPTHEGHAAPAPTNAADRHAPAPADHGDNHATAQPKQSQPETRYEMRVDTTHIVKAWPRVRFYRSDMQGLCDSMTFVQKDSTLFMHRHPIVWSDERQIYGNIIKLHLNDSTIDRADLPDFAFTAQCLEPDFYNQLTGKEMTAFFENAHLKTLDVSGSVEGILFPEENDSTINKMVNFQTAFLKGWFNRNNVERIKTWPETSGEVTPLYLAKKSKLLLAKFKWYAELRPMTPADVFVVPKEMDELMGDTKCPEMPRLRAVDVLSAEALLEIEADADDAPQQ